MTDFAAALTQIRRPKILIRAARAGLAEYRPERDLKRLCRETRGGDAALAPLIAEERRLEATRTCGAGGYNIQRHVAVLTALLAEARRIAEARPLAARPAIACPAAA